MSALSAAAGVLTVPLVVSKEEWEASRVWAQALSLPVTFFEHPWLKTQN